MGFFSVPAASFLVVKLYRLLPYLLYLFKYFLNDNRLVLLSAKYPTSDDFRHMSNIDRQFLKEVGLSMDEAAVLLKISRPHLYHLTNDKQQRYLNQERLNLLYTRLSESPHKSDQERAAKVVDWAAKLYQLDVQPGEQAVGDYYMIFTDKPLELKQPPFQEYMTKYVYPRARVVAYFLDPEGEVNKMKKKLEAARRQSSEHWKSRIFIIETILGAVLPHVGIRIRFVGRDSGMRGETWEAETSGAVRLNLEYVTKITTLLEDAGFRFQVDHKPEDFFPKNSNGVTETSDGAFTFKKVFELSPDNH